MAFTQDDIKFLGKMFEKQRKEINRDIAEVISDQILPKIDDLSEKVNNLTDRVNNLTDRVDDLTEDVKCLSKTTDRIERKLENHQDYLDNNGQRISKLEKLHPTGKHAPA